MNIDEQKKKREKKSNDKENIIKSAYVFGYNKGMRGIDKQNQLLAFFPIMQKYIKG